MKSQSVKSQSVKSSTSTKYPFTIPLAFVSVFVMIVLFSPKDVNAQSLAPDNAVSTVQIIVKSCYFPGVSSEKVAWQFFACYDRAPGKELFIRCQKKTFNGVLFDSVRNIRNNCSQPKKIPTYARCLMREFRKAHLDMNVAVRKLNGCQLPVLQKQ